MRYFLYFFFFFCSIFSFTQAQTHTDSTLADATLPNCVQYALKHYPAVQQALVDEQITEREIKTKLSEWYPQINLGYNFQDNFQLPTVFSLNEFFQSGTAYSSNIGLGATQNIFSQDLLLATRTANDVRKQAKQNSVSNKIDITVNVSKAFYDVLFTKKEIEVLDEDIVRLQRSVKDAYNQYQGGVVDKIDYKQATIQLNNTQAQRKQTADLVVAKYAYLKQLMGYPDEDTLMLQYDTTQMENDALIDTNVAVNYQARIEYQQLVTQQRLLQANLKYYKWSFLPSLYAYGGYNFGYLDNEFSKLYSAEYPNSDIGLTLAVPIFQGTKRVQQIKEAELQLQRLDWDFASLKNTVNTQFQQALAVYKGNLTNYYSLKDNVALASDVYNTVRLQYSDGIKTYLDVIVAESDLRSSQLNYYNALFQVLQSKFDVQKALGTIQY